MQGTVVVEHAKGLRLPRRQVRSGHVLDVALDELLQLRGRLPATAVKEDEGVSTLEHAGFALLAVAQDPCHRLLQAVTIERRTEPVRVALAGHVVGYRQSLVVDDVKDVSRIIWVKDGGVVDTDLDSLSTFDDGGAHNMDHELQESHVLTQARHVSGQRPRRTRTRGREAG